MNMTSALQKKAEIGIQNSLKAYSKCMKNWLKRGHACIGSAAYLKPGRTYW